jgi:hypothetical protein
MLGVHPDDARQLRQRGMIVPRPLVGWGLLDSGAQLSVVTVAAMATLRIPTLSRMKIAGTAGDVPLYRPLHFVSVVISQTGHPEIGTRAVAIPKHQDDNLAVIGRDVLRYFTLCVDGRDGGFSLEW